MSRKLVSVSSLQVLFARFVLATIIAAPALLAQQAGGVAPAGPLVHLVRSVEGAKGEQRNGSFVMTEPRSTFYVPEDREVIVYFEWEGIKGVHHCEGSVRAALTGSSPRCPALTTLHRSLVSPDFGACPSPKARRRAVGFLKAELTVSKPVK